MQPDVKQYLPLMEGYDLSENEKRAFLNALWHVIENFVDRAFSCDSTQLATSTKSLEHKTSGQDSTKRLGLSKQSSIEANV